MNHKNPQNQYALIRGKSIIFTCQKSTYKTLVYLIKYTGTHVSVYTMVWQDWLN